MAKMEFKEFLLEQLASAPDDVKDFASKLGFFFMEEKLIVTGPEVPDAPIADYVSTIKEAAKAWATENNIAHSEVVVSANGAELGLDEYSALYQVNDAPAPTGSFIEDDPEFANEAQDDVDESISGIQYDEDLSSDDLIARSNQLNGFANLISRSQENAQAKQSVDKEDPDQPVESGSSSGVADLLKGTSKLFTKPITVPAALLAKGAKRLNGWRLERPSRMLTLADESSAKLIENIKTFKDEDYVKLEAEVKARGGWDFELSQKFESFLDTGKRRDEWKLIVTQMKEFGHYSKKALGTNSDQAQDVHASLDERAAEISSLASDIPYSLKKGVVAQTVYEVSEQLREAIREMVQRLINLITRSAGSKTSPSV